MPQQRLCKADRKPCCVGTSRKWGHREQLMAVLVEYLVEEMPGIVMWE
jgi:hypothetical protein